MRGKGENAGQIDLRPHRGKWALRLADGRRLSTGVAATRENLDLAERAAREILTALAAAAPLATIADLLDAYVADMPRRANPKRAGDGVVYAVKALKTHYQGVPLDHDQRAESRRYVEKRRAAGRKDGTIRKELGVLAAAINWRCGRNAAAIDLPAPSPARERWLTRDEVRRLLADAALPAHVATFIHLALATGARAEALLTLRWSLHVDLGAGEFGRVTPGVKLGGKGRARAIPLTAEARAALDAAREIARTDFVIEWAGKPVASVRKALSAAYARAKIRNVSAPAHVLRHTAGAWMAMGDPARGVPPVEMFEISRRLGHASIATTEKHYAHLHPDYMQASTAALEIG